MLSTLRILRNRSLLHVDLIAKGSKADYHICLRNIQQLQTRPDSLRRKLRSSSLPLQSINFLSTGSPQSDAPKPGEELVENIPEPPTPILEQADVQLSGEPSFESLGLGGWTPVGFVENCLEYLHINCDLPWWTSIVIGTIVVRTLLFPLVILSQRNAAKMNNNLPEMQAIQLKMSDARERGDRLDAARYAQELLAFMKEKDLNPFKNMLVPLAQAPLFISFFMGLRAMSNLPVESLREGGLFWFVDLTLPDQFYLLPIITSLTLFVTIEVGTDAARMNAANMGMMRYAIRAMPLIIFPFTVGFPAAILVYWTSTNFISLLQVSILKIPRVRTYFKIEPLVKHDNQKLPIKDKGFVKGVRDTWTNMKITRELEERERIDEINFSRAGKGAVKKTYKYDPTQSRPPRNFGAIQVKKRD